MTFFHLDEPGAPRVDPTRCAAELSTFDVVLTTYKTLEAERGQARRTDTPFPHPHPMIACTDFVAMIASNDCIH